MCGQGRASRPSGSARPLRFFLSPVALRDFCFVSFFNVARALLGRKSAYTLHPSHTLNPTPVHAHIHAVGERDAIPRKSARVNRYIITSGLNKLALQQEKSRLGGRQFAVTSA